MNLLKLRKRLKFAIRGHKLLKDKQEQLTKEFNNLILKLIELRSNIEQKLNEIYHYVEILHKYFPKETFEELCEKINSLKYFEVLEEKQSKFNLKQKIFKIKKIKENFEIFTTDFYFNIFVVKMFNLYPLILELSNLETLFELMAKELQTTRRRVNALEYILIPQIQQGIKNILSKLNEIERTNIIQLMRIKQLMQ
ncbi:MAG: V-type ATP synthase subunit D, partial [Endomicrobiia bacterium]